MSRNPWYHSGCISGRDLTLLMLILLGVLGLVSCDVFSPREPEAPIGTGSDFEPATSPTILLRNFQNSLRTANTLDYRRCFSDGSGTLQDYLFTPAADGAAVAPGRFAEWSLADEEGYLRTLLSELLEGGVPTVILTPPDVTEAPIGDSIRFEAEYSVNFPHTRAGVEREGFGRLIFTMKLSERNEWYITTWRDLPLDGRATWSVIKARFSQ